MILYPFIDLFPMSSGASEWVSERKRERSGARKRSEQCGASERVSDASEQRERTSEWLTTIIPISRGSESQCTCQSCHVWNIIISSKMDLTLYVCHFAIARWRFHQQRLSFRSFAHIADPLKGHLRHLAAPSEAIGSILWKDCWMGDAGCHRMIVIESYNFIYK